MKRWLKIVLILVVVFLALGLGAFLILGFSPLDLIQADFEMEPEDCFPGELYDPIEKICYIECGSREECDRIYDEILQKAGEIGEDYYEGDKQFEELPLPDFWQGEEGEIVLATYDIQGDTITNMRAGEDVGDYAEWQEDTTKHRQLWERFAGLFPAASRADLARLEIFTDGKEGGLAAVYQDQSDPARWVLVVDIVDAFKNDQLDTKELTFTLIHEFGHLLTLNARQVPPDLEIMSAASDIEYARIFEQKQESCDPSFFTGEGCSLEESYINRFFQRFWVDIFEEFAEIQAIEDEDDFYEEMDAFYQRYADRFVTDYAATNPGEDIAESWTYFVLNQKPAGDAIRDQKVLFFYDYPELVRLRDYIRAAL